MKNDSPNKFLGALTAGIAGSRGSGGAFGSFLNSALGRAAAQVAGPTQAQQAASGGLAGAIGSSLGGSSLGGNTNLASDLGAATMDQANPFAGKTFQITPANMKGNAKPVFNKSTSDAAAMMYGSPLERQMSMPKAGTSAMSMKDIPEGDKGAGLRKLPNSVVEQMGYDSATKMVSPVEFHEGVSHKYSLNAENYADSVRVAKREKRFNEMMEPKMMKTITNMPYTEEQLKAKPESIKKSEAQELPRIKRK